MNRAEMQQQLVDHYLDFFSVAMAIVRDEDDAREVVQEALTRTMTRLYVKSPCDYCVRIIKNLSMNMLQRRSRLVGVDEMMLVTDYEHERLLQLVAEKRDELSDVAKAIVELHDEDGYTLSEVAGMMQMSISSVKRILADAHCELRKKIEREL